MAGWFAASAAAGDKIEFSTLETETLAPPAVDRAESEPAVFLAGFSLNYSPPPTSEIYPFVSTAAEPVGRRDNEFNSRHGTDGLGSDLEKTWRNDRAEDSSWNTSATNYSSKPASNYLDTLDAWGRPVTAGGPGRGMDRFDSRYGQASERLDSSTALARRERQIGLNSGDAGFRSRSANNDGDSSSATKTTVADLLNLQSRSYLDGSYGLFKPLSAYDDARVSSAWGSPSDGLLSSRLDAGDAGYGVNKTPSTRSSSMSSGRNFGGRDQGNSGGWSGMTAWGGGQGVGYQSPSPAPARKPLAAPGTSGAQGQMGGASLPRPKMPGSVFN
jgi:hypothetical protein